MFTAYATHSMVFLLQQPNLIDNKGWQVFGDKGTFISFKRMFVGAATMEIQEIQVQVPYDRTIPLLGLHPKELKKDLNMIIYIFHVCCSISHNRQ